MKHPIALTLLLYEVPIVNIISLWTVVTFCSLVLIYKAVYETVEIAYSTLGKEYKIYV